MLWIALAVETPLVLALIVLCRTAYMINAERIECSAAIPKVITFSFKIISRKGHAERKVIQQGQALPGIACRGEPGLGD